MLVQLLPMDHLSSHTGLFSLLQRPGIVGHLKWQMSNSEAPFKVEFTGIRVPVISAWVTKVTFQHDWHSKSVNFAVPSKKAVTELGGQNLTGIPKTASFFCFLRKSSTVYFSKKGLTFPIATSLWDRNILCGWVLKIWCWSSEITQWVRAQCATKPEDLSLDPKGPTWW